MSDPAEYLIGAALIGAGATLATDAWAWLRQRLTGVAPPDYGLVGRWIAWMPRGRFRHDSIAKAPSMPHERVIGWTAHYLIGIAFASVLLAIWGLDWVRHPTFAPAMIVGIGSVVAPLLILQPGMGHGIAASRTPDPARARLRSLVMHAVFGVGLYVAGVIVSRVLA